VESTHKAWKHLLIDLDETLTSISTELNISKQGVFEGLFRGRSKRVQKHVLHLAKQKGIPIPQELSTII